MTEIYVLPTEERNSTVGLFSNFDDIRVYRTDRHRALLRSIHSVAR